MWSDLFLALSLTGCNLGLVSASCSSVSPIKVEGDDLSQCVLNFTGWLSNHLDLVKMQGLTQQIWGEA